MSDPSDWRSALTRRAVQKSREGVPIAIRGGPKVGKHYLADRVRAELGDAASPILLLEDPWAEAAPGAFGLPLIPLPRHHVLRLFGEHVWDASAGHPYLISGVLNDSLEAHRQSLSERLERHRDACPRAFEAWSRARSFTGTPRERYLDLCDVLDDSKGTLDQAAVLGLINRSMFGDSAGVVAVPFA